MKNVLTALLLTAFACTAFAQITFKIETLPDNVTYKISMTPNVTYTYPGNLVASGQITIRVPHGFGSGSFIVSDLLMLTPGAGWEDNARVNSPSEAPSWDYISFGLITFGTDDYTFTSGVEIPVLSFKNGAAFCADSIEIIDKNDPFLPPNSVGANIGNTIVTLGGGLNNLYSGNFGTGKVVCSPNTICTVGETTNVHLCNGETFQDSLYLTNASIEEHYTTSDGCDSAIVTAITVGITTYATIDTAICQGEIFMGTPVVQSQTLTDTLLNSLDCDSIVTYQVQMLSPTSSESDVTLLPGMIYNGVSYSNDTTVVYSLTGANGCDSLSTIHISIYSVPVSVQETHVCYGEPYNGVVYPVSTTLVDTLTGALGFDSLLLTNVFVHPVHNSLQNYYLCYGMPYNGVVFEQDTMLVSNLSTAFGCDSNIFVNLHILVPQFISLDTTICQGESILGYTPQNDTLIAMNIPAANGCDSLVVNALVHVSFLPYATIQGETVLCGNETKTLKAFGGATFLWSNGSTANSLEINAAGDYSVTVTNNEGCQDAASIAVSAFSLNAQAEGISPGCGGGSDGEIFIANASGGTPPYAYSINGGQLFTTQNLFGNLEPGVYQTMVEDDKGCLWQQTVTLIEPDNLQLEIGENSTIKLGENFRFHPSTTMQQIASIQWSPALGLSCTDCLDPIASPLETTTYRLLLLDSTGCRLEDKIQITVNAGRDIFVPSAFSPNGDGVNDLLMVYGGTQVATVRRFSVFDRWGGSLFEAENFQPNDPAISWEGRARGKELTSGIYAWATEVEFVDGVVQLFHGTVNLLK